MSRAQHLIAFAAAFGAFLGFAGVAHAGGGNYVFDGGTPRQQQQVRSALEASSFNWSLVTQQITIKIAPIGSDYSLPGQIFLDSDLLNSPGDYSWGVVQNEYANQVDFFLLPQQAQATFNGALGGAAWCYGDQPGLNMTHYGCERFASTLAWAYWQSPDNCIRPSASGGISGGMAPAAFKALLTSTLGIQTETAHTTASTPVSTQSFTTRNPAATLSTLTQPVAPMTKAVRQAQNARTTDKTALKGSTRTASLTRSSVHTAGQAR
jgi:hypothetical protein